MTRDFVRQSLSKSIWSRIFFVFLYFYIHLFIFIRNKHSFIHFVGIVSIVHHISNMLHSRLKWRMSSKKCQEKKTNLLSVLLCFDRLFLFVWISINFGKFVCLQSMFLLIFPHFVHWFSTMLHSIELLLIFRLKRNDDLIPQMKCILLIINSKLFLSLSWYSYSYTGNLHLLLVTHLYCWTPTDNSEHTHSNTPGIRNRRHLEGKKRSTKRYEPTITGLNWCAFRLGSFVFFTRISIPL